MLNISIEAKAGPNHTTVNTRTDAAIKKQKVHWLTEPLDISLDDQTIPPIRRMMATLLTRAAAIPLLIASFVFAVFVRVVALL